MDSSELKKYRRGEIIGEGPSGVVYRGEDKATSRSVAIKVLHRIPRDHEPYAGKEYRDKLMTLEHPNLCPVFEYVQTNDEAAIIEEVVDGISLDKVLLEHRSIHPPLANIAIPITRALAVLHQSGLVHGNIKPSNIFLQTSGEVRLLDAGLGGQILAVDKPDEAPAPTWMRYLTPDQVQGEKSSEQTDLYQLGLVLYELAFQTPAVKETDPNKLRELIVNQIPACESFTDIPGDWVLTLNKLFSRNPEERFKSAEDLLVTLEEIAQFNSRQDLMDTRKKRDASPRQYFMMSVLVGLLLILWYIVTSYH